MISRGVSVGDLFTNDLGLGQHLMHHHLLPTRLHHLDRSLGLLPLDPLAHARLHGLPRPVHVAAHRTRPASAPAERHGSPLGRPPRQFSRGTHRQERQGLAV